MAKHQNDSPHKKECEPLLFLFLFDKSLSGSEVSTQNNMPRISERLAVLNRLESMREALLRHGRRQTLFGVSTTVTQDLLYACRLLRQKVKSSRYLHKRGSYRRRSPKFEVYLAVVG